MGGSVLRILLVPFMMLCAGPRTSPIISGEATPLILSALLGVSNGVLGSVPMILAPTKVQDEHRELTGNIMTFSYYLGLTLGASVAYGLDDILGKPLNNLCGDKVIVPNLQNVLKPTAFTEVTSTASTFRFHLHPLLNISGGG